MQLFKKKELNIKKILKFAITLPLPKKQCPPKDEVFFAHAYMSKILKCVLESFLLYAQNDQDD